MKKGAKITNPQSKKTLIVGKGVAKKYTDASFPSGRKPKAEAPG